ncbi:MAG: hypothetical protein SGJ17_08655 [Hyphomicrobiales bacterium]|nr:hypothetical protein [Hyphomicrobiales bacterium]
MAINEQEREDLLRRDGSLIGIAALSLINGMHFSPYFDAFSIFLRPIAAGFFITSPLVFLYLSSLLLSSISLMLSGIPAALFERATGRTRSDNTSMTVWLVTALILAIPTFLYAAGML